MELVFIKILLRNIPKLIRRIIYSNKELVIVAFSENLFALFRFLKNYSGGQFQQLSEATAVDFPEKINRFELIYFLLSIRYNCRLRIKINISEVIAVPSVHFIYLNSNWLEREIWEFFGVIFKGHVELKRLLTDYGFSGYPLRKDFPVTGFFDLRYEDSNQRIVYKAIEISKKIKNYFI